MSFADIISACLGSSSPAQRQAPYLSADEAANMPLEAFVHRSIESAPSALEQNSAFSDILRKHIEGGADAGRVAQAVQDALTRLASNDADRASAQWACRILALTAQAPAAGSSGYHPPQAQGQSYAQAAGTDGGGWEVQRPHHQSQPPAHPQKQGDTYVRSYFFPSEESFQALVQFLGSAHTSLDICVFNITDNGVADAIIAAKRRGVDVRIITDDEQLQCRGSDVERLQRDHDIPFKTDNDPSKFMHAKFAVIDRRAVWCGSYNWTVAGRRQNNEAVICTNDLDAARAFSAEFDKLWSQFQ
ncbi:hypothetical protein IWW55_002760 [Coemansia sp. RSA 2706]|nr:hypothetical protein IWW55_002760 [Coemansia sp. RSA 2706]KAJ2326106.1 hypothetical protein IWW51_002446 [Coemansia sp. RSA 2702]